jgi:hypothetical protein
LGFIVKYLVAANDAMELHLLMGVLAGITAEVHDEFMQGVLPTAYPKIYVADEDMVAAQAALRVHQEGTLPAKGEPWKCVCGEEMESQFSACWNCGARLSQG